LVEWANKKVVGSLIVLLFTVIFAPILVNQYVNQPVINYRLNAVDMVNFEYQSLSVELSYCNRGGMDASIFLVLTTENAIIEKPEPLPSFITYNETHTEIYISTWKNMDYYASESLNILPKNNPETFSLTFTVTKNFDIVSIFWTSKPIYPTTLTYYQTDTNQYTKVIE